MSNEESVGSPTEQHQKLQEEELDVELNTGRSQEYKSSNRATLYEVRNILIVVAVLVVLCAFFAIMYFVGPFADPKRRISFNAEREILNEIYSDNCECEANMQKYTRSIAMAGTKEGHNYAIELQKQMVAYGLTDTTLRQYDVFLTHPTHESKLEILELEEEDPGDEPELETIYTASLYEESVPYDSDSQVASRAPTFNAYSANGEFTGELVYANYGRLEDFQYLEQRNISVKDKVVIVRYGQIFRGVKVLNAEARGARALLIYTDPKDTGYGRGDILPTGPWGPDFVVERGSTLYLSKASGDPSSFGEAAIPELQRKKYPSYDLNDKEDLFEGLIAKRLLVQPVSTKQALEFLKIQSGPNAPADWQGGITGITYKTGGTPSNFRVHVKVQLDRQIRPIYNVITKIQGSEEADRLVILGHHFDTWVYGAVDPQSSTINSLELARALGKLVQQGWKPKRTLILAHWDAEEFGLIGSTEFAEEYKSLLQDQAVAYLNTDVSLSDAFRLLSTPSLASVVLEESKKITFKNGQTIYDHWTSANNALREDKSVDLSKLYGNIGSGSDYTAFYHHLGVPSMHLGFNGKYGVYHSILDSFYYYKTFGDPEFHGCRANAAIWGLVALRLSDDEVLPFDFKEYSQFLSREVDKLLASKELAAILSNANQNPAFLELRNLTAQIQEAVAQFYSQVAQQKVNGTPLSRRMLNDKLMKAERQFLDEKGFKQRPFYKHTIFAPGYYKGYGADVFPMIQDVIQNAGSLSELLEAVQVLNIRLQALVRYFQL